MRYIKTTNFDKFKCIADRCPSSCCEGWQIVIDEEAQKKYLTMQGDFKNRIMRSIDWEEGCFKQHGRRCAMLNENGLCDLIIACGEESLCYTCREYPRHTEEYEGLREKSLSLSCPEAARIIIENQEKIEFIEAEDDEEDDFEDFDYLLYTKLYDAREVMYKFIQNRELKFYTKAGILASFAEKLQGLVNEGELFAMDDVIAEYDAWAERPWHAPVSDKWQSAELFDILEKLEVLLPEWPEIVRKTKKSFGQVELTDKEEVIAEQLLMFFIYTYFCGAVYDDWILSKVYLAICSVLWIFQIDRAMNVPDIIKTAYTYAREVEHSDLNLDDIEDWFNEKIEV